MSKWIHKLTEINELDQTAICSNCGVTSIKKKGRIWRCKTGNTYDKKKWKQPPKNTSCEICDSTEYIVWDHDHKTGKFRGWLCRLCNSGLGFYKDNPESLYKAAQYLNRKIW